MAHLEVTIPEQTTPDRRSELVKNLTDTVGNILGFPQEMRKMISIRLTHYGRNEVARGGILVDEKKANLYHLNAFLPRLEWHQKQELLQHLTNAFSDSLRLGGEERRAVFVTLQEFAPENVASGGRSVAETAAV